jgi:Ser/Thr protein kinase RdoA (MazF antagonist)
VLVMELAAGTHLGGRRLDGAQLDAVAEAHRDLERLTPATVRDPSPANYLWDGRRVVLVDFEDAGWRDRAVELADLVEHAQSRNTPAAAWGRVLDRLGLDGRERARHRAARRLFGLFWLFWLTLLDRPGADLSPAAQLERVGGLLAGDDGYCR